MQIFLSSLLQVVFFQTNEISGRVPCGYGSTSILFQQYSALLSAMPIISQCCHWPQETLSTTCLSLQDGSIIRRNEVFISYVTSVILWWEYSEIIQPLIIQAVLSVSHPQYSVRSPILKPFSACIFVVCVNTAVFHASEWKFHSLLSLIPLLELLYNEVCCACVMSDPVTCHQTDRSPYFLGDYVFSLACS